MANLLILSMIILSILIISCLAETSRVVKGGSLSQDIPLYPITASWFRDRFTAAEWNRTLSEFAAQGGDTVWLRAPPLVVRTKEDIQVCLCFSAA